MWANRETANELAYVVASFLFSCAGTCYDHDCADMGDLKERLRGMYSNEGCQVVKVGTTACRSMKRLGHGCCRHVSSQVTRAARASNSVGRWRASGLSVRGVQHHEIPSESASQYPTNDDIDVARRPGVPATPTDGRNSFAENLEFLAHVAPDVDSQAAALQIGEHAAFEERQDRFSQFPFV